MNDNEIIFQNDNWTITMNSPRRSGWIKGKYRGSINVSEPWAYYDNEFHWKTAFIPQYVKDAIAKAVLT